MSIYKKNLHAHVLIMKYVQMAKVCFMQQITKVYTVYTLSALLRLKIIPAYPII